MLIFSVLEVACLHGRAAATLPGCAKYCKAGPACAVPTARCECERFRQ